MKLFLLEKRPLIGDIVSFVFKPETEVNWQPGQFMHYTLRHKNPDDRGTERWFTISSAPFEKNIVISTRIFAEKKSSFKTTLNNMKIGEAIEADGPKGKFILDNRKGNNVFMAGGIGVTPFRSMFAQTSHDGSKINGHLIYLNREGVFAFKPEFDKILSMIGIKVDYLPTIDNSYFTSKDDNSKTNFYLSGPEPMVEHYQKLLISLKFPDEQIFTDFFPGYKWDR